MNSNDKPKELETIGEAAARLLAGFDERAKKSGFVPVKIAVLCRYPLSAESKARALTIVAMEYSTKCQGAAFTGWEAGAGKGTVERAGFSIESASVASTSVPVFPGTARPTQDADGGSKDRAIVTLLRLGE